jgi:hypothetical protein
VSHAAFGHMLAHMVLRGLVYAVIWKVLHQLTFPEALVLLAATIALFGPVWRGAPRSLGSWR